MTVQYSTTLQNDRLDTIESTIGTTPKLYIRTGAQPADCSQADSGSLLCTITLPSDWMNAASGGTKTLLGTWSNTASGTGTAAHFRIKETTETTCHMQGSITATSGGGDIELDNTSISSGQTVTISSFTITEGNP